MGEYTTEYSFSLNDIDASVGVDNSQKGMYLKAQDLFTTQYGPNLRSQLSGLYRNTYVSHSWWKN